VKISIVINNDSVNNGGYCLNVNELIDAGVDMSLVEYPHSLHDKFCIIDDETVINGFYNWTRFSENNYENVMVFRDNKEVAEEFCREFDSIISKAEHKSVERMPDAVPERLEYDRNAFKQYITEELDAQAKETSNQRDKITALKQAAKVNPKYLEKIDPNAIAENKEAFNVVEQSEQINKEIISIMNKSIGNPETNTILRADTNNRIPIKIEDIKAASMYLVLDVSGSMSNTYDAGHVHNIAEKVLAASLVVSNTQEVSLWTFGDNAEFIATIGLNNIEDIKQVKCKNEGTELSAFVDKASPSMQDGALVIIFTDDDGASINEAIEEMKSKENAFWQIIVYGTHSPNISTAVEGIDNASLRCLQDNDKKSNSEISQILLSEYIAWKRERTNSL